LHGGIEAPTQAFQYRLLKQTTTQHDSAYSLPLALATNDLL
jgi:hypothetical protein